MVFQGAFRHPSFKSHRDKVQIVRILPADTTFTGFKSHRDKVQMLSTFAVYRRIKRFQIPQGQSSNRYIFPIEVQYLHVSNPIGTKFKYFIAGKEEVIRKCFKSHRDKVQIIADKYNLFNIKGFQIRVSKNTHFPPKKVSHF